MRERQPSRSFQESQELRTAPVVAFGLWRSRLGGRSALAGPPATRLLVFQLPLKTTCQRVATQPLALPVQHAPHPVELRRQALPRLRSRLRASAARGAVFLGVVYGDGNDNCRRDNRPHKKGSQQGADGLLTSLGGVLLHE